MAAENSLGSSERNGDTLTPRPPSEIPIELSGVELGIGIFFKAPEVIPYAAKGSNCRKVLSLATLTLEK